MSKSSTDAQDWVWPPAGAAVPPIAATGSFGPVNLGDSMVLEWTPATNPEIDLTCVSESGIYTNTFAAKLASSPLTFPFKDTAKTNGTEKIFCHFFFNPSVMGNTVTFEFQNEARSKAVTWSQNKATTSSSKTSPSSTKTPDAASSPTSPSNPTPTPPQASPSPSQTPNTTPRPAHTGLPASAAAGIGIGVAIVLFSLAALIIFLTRKKKKRRQSVIGELPTNHAYHEKDAHTRYEKGRPVFVTSAELEGSPTAHQLP